MNENQIDRYLLNLLNQEEKEAFEKELEINPALAKEVEQQKSILEDIEGMGRIEMKAKLQKIHKELYGNDHNQKSIFRSLFFKIAAAAVFFGVLSFGWWCLQNNETSATLYTQNFEPFELSLSERSEGDMALNKIENLYLDGKYTEAIPVFQDALNEAGSQNSQLLLGLGISYLQTEQAEKSIPQFLQILMNKDFNYEDEAQWYLGLAYLKLNQIDLAKEHFNVLAADATKDHHQASKTLLSQLKKK
jgi:tetratricopeptide (TPR) repeat protein